MNAATRTALQKRKQALASARNTPVTIDTEEIREATRRKLTELLETGAKNQQLEDNIDKKDAKELGKAIESSLNEKHKAHTPAYKSSFRRLYASLKSKSTDFQTDLLTGKLSPHDFATKSAEELKSAQQKTADEKLKQEGIRQSVGTQLLPENVNQIKDGRDREKWGVSRSAAAIDD